MARVAVIEYCGDCPHRYYEDIDLHCDKTGKKVAENMEIPDFCPLPIVADDPAKAELVEALEIARTSLENDGFGKSYALCLAGKALANAKGE